MKEDFINEVMEGMLPNLDNMQMTQLKRALGKVLSHYDLRESSQGRSESNSSALLDRFIAAKRIEGCSEKTLDYYQNTINAMLSTLGKHTCRITTEDLRMYLTEYQEEHGSSRITIDNIRRKVPGRAQTGDHSS